MEIPKSSGFLAAVCLLAATIYGVSAVNLEMEPRNAIVFPGQNISLLCRAGVPLTYCRISLSGNANALNLNPKTKPTKEYAYYGSGLQSGQCGITLFSVTDKFNGEISCTGGTELEAEESVAKTRLTVTKTPRDPELIVLPSTSGKGSNNYKEGDILQASCAVREGRPVANITWYLGEDVVTGGVRSVIDTDERSNLYTMKSNLTRKLSWNDNNRDLRCVAGHIAIGPKSYASKTFNVRYAPRDISMPIEQFGFTVGETGKVIVEVLANPQPSLTWLVGNTQISEGERDPTGKLEAAKGLFLQANESDPLSQGQGKWQALLYINQVTMEDVEREYYLKAWNSEGEKKYRVVISTLTEPQAMLLGAGPIIGIIIAVLVLLLIVILIIFAWRTGRWCCAGAASPKHDPRESSDTESHGELATLEKKKKKKSMMARFFKTKNDKVSADPDDIKSVPLDDDKDMLKDDPDKGPLDNKDVVYAELDLQLNRSPVIIREDEKTEYAEIVHSKPDV